MHERVTKIINEQDLTQKQNANVIASIERKLAYFAPYQDALTTRPNGNKEGEFIGANGFPCKVFINENAGTTAITINPGSTEEERIIITRSGIFVRLGYQSEAIYDIPVVKALEGNPIKAPVRNTVRAA